MGKIDLNKIKKLKLFNSKNKSVPAEKQNINYSNFTPTTKQPINVVTGKQNNQTPPTNNILTRENPPRTTIVNNETKTERVISQFINSRSSIDKERKRLSPKIFFSFLFLPIIFIFKNPLILGLLLIILILYGNFSFSINDSLNSLNQTFGGLYSVEGMNILTSVIVPIIIIIYFIFIFYNLNFNKENNKSFGELNVRFLSFIVIFLLLFFLFDKYFLVAPIDEREELVESTRQGFFDSISNSYKGIQCNVLKLTNEARYQEECVIERAEENAQVTQSQQVQISHNSPNIRTLYLASPSEGFDTSISVSSPIPITLNGFSCFISTDPRTPFYTGEIENQELIGDKVSYSYQCENLGDKIEQEQITARVYSDLDFSIENTFSLNVPIIDCGHPQIRNIMEQNGFSSCNSLSLDFLQNQGITIPQWDRNARGGNAVELLTNKFTEDPIRINSDSNINRNLVLSVKSQNLIGKISKTTISIDLPPQLSIADNGEQTKEIEAFNDEVMTNYRLTVNDENSFETIDPVFTDQITLTIDANLTRRFTERYDFIVIDFEPTTEENNSEELEE